VIAFFLPSVTGTNFSSDHGTTTFFSPTPATPPRPDDHVGDLTVLIDQQLIDLAQILAGGVPMMSFVSCSPASFFHTGGLVSAAEAISGVAKSTATKPASNFFI